MNKYAIVISHLCKKYGAQVVLNDVSMTFSSKGFYGILGPSGCGKTTLLNILSGLIESYQGHIAVLGKDYSNFDQDALSEFRLKNMGFVFQQYDLLELETALNNVLFPISSVYDDSKEVRVRKAKDLLRFVGLSRKETQTVKDLSGGEKQRVCLARALANDPPILLCDEPTGALDAKNAEAVFSLLSRIGKKRLVIMVSHDESGCKRYCDHIIRMKNGCVVGSEENEKALECGEPPASLVLARKKPSSRLSQSFLFSHAIHVAKKKKGRLILSEISIGLGLLGLGLSFFVKDTISSEITKAFSSIIPEATLLMSPRSDGATTISNVYGASLDQASLLVEAYPDDIKGVGTMISMDYPSVFCDEDYFTLHSGATSALLPGFSARSINDFLWLEDYGDHVFYPYRPAKLEWSEICLGLPYSTMANLCYNFGIHRSFQSLGDYIAGHSLKAILSLAHYEWEFEDEELFTVVSITPTDEPAIFHTDHLWNRKIFLDQLLFHSTPLEENVGFQSVFELPYIETKGNQLDFIDKARRDERFRDYIFEKPNSTYIPSHCVIGEMCEINRLYIYSGDKNGVRWTDLDEVMETCPEALGRLPTSDGAYYGNSDSVITGFRGKFFIAESQESANQVIDAFSDLPVAQADLPLELPEGAVDGSLLASNASGLCLSSDLSNIDYGRAPKGLDEIVLSSSLLKKWDRPRTVFIVAETSSDIIGNNRCRTFGCKEVKVVGEKENSRDICYVTSDWTIDFFLERLGMSSFFLEPNGAVFSFENNGQASAAKEKLARAFPQYSFSCPAEEIGESISGTVDYLGAVISSFSVIALSMSCLLFCLTMAITMKENEKEGKLLHRIGISRRDIVRSNFSYSLLYCFVSLGGGIITILLAEAAVGFYVSKMFSTPFRFHISYTPLLAICFATAMLLLVSYVSISVMTKRANNGND